MAALRGEISTVKKERRVFGDDALVWSGDVLLNVSSGSIEGIGPRVMSTYLPFTSFLLVFLFPFITLCSFFSLT